MSVHILLLVVNNQIDIFNLSSIKNINKNTIYFRQYSKT